MWASFASIEGNMAFLTDLRNLAGNRAVVQLLPDAVVAKKKRQTVSRMGVVLGWGRFQ